MAGTKFVRLREDLARGGRYDLQSGWGISGYDVKEMPDEETEPRAFAYVTGEIRAGRIEPASRAEYDEVHPDLAADLGFTTNKDGTKPFQERAVQQAARRGHTKVRAKRKAETEVDAFEADEARRKATIAAQKGQESRGKSKAAQKSAAEAEEEAEAATRAHLAAEAEARSAGASRVAGANPVVDDDDDDDDDDTEGDAYDEMGKDALKEEARSRDLTVGGTADELRERLRAHDAENADDESDEDDESDDEGDDNQS